MKAFIIVAMGYHSFSAVFCFQMIATPHLLTETFTKTAWAGEAILEVALMIWGMILFIGLDQKGGSEA